MQIFYYDEYHFKELRLSPAPVILDIGANIGAFARFAQLQYGDAQIYAYEPEPENYALLSKNIPNIPHFDVAIGGKEGKLPLYLNIDTTGHTMVRGNVNPSKKVIEEILVDQWSLNKVLENLPHIAILKLDVEGSEFEALFNVNPAFLQRVDNFMIEIHSSHDTYTTQDLIDFIEQQGFVLKRKVAEVYWFVR